jgi:Flp pilus assembly protein TadG
VILRRGRTRAQSLLEFALVLPLFLLMMLALIDFGRLLFSYASLANGARELSRSMTITGNSAVTAISAFNNLTIVGGTISPATTITLQPSSGSGSGSGSTSCTATTSPLCTLKVTTTSTSTSSSTTTNVTVASYAGGVGTASYTETTNNPLVPAPSYQFNPTSTGDFVMLTWLHPDIYNLMQGYIQICQLPLTSACTFPNFPAGPPATTRSTFTDGFVQTDVGYNFQFNPLFQNRLTGVIDVSFMRPSTLVTTSVRTYAE